MQRNVLYWNPSATPDLRSILEQEMPRDWTLRVLDQDGSADALLADCDFMIVADRSVTAQDFNKIKRLRMIQHQGVGYERIDIQACREHGVLLGLTPEGTTNGVAEHTILLILAIYKQLIKAATGVRTGHWMQWELRQNSFEISGKTVGLVGFGRIGRAVAARARAFEATVLYFDPFLAEAGAEDAERASSLQELLSRSDIVSLHLPGSASNRKLIGAPALRTMKSTAILINTSRGNIVDEAALYEALQSGWIAGAGLDVLEQEPAAATNPLLSLDNVVVTPHISAGTVDAFRTKMRAVCDNLLRFDRGEAPLNLAPEFANVTVGHTS
jgi:phosphoglycerate dehydrogenase-like enzyme